MCPSTFWQSQYGPYLEVFSYWIETQNNTHTNRQRKSNQVILQRWQTKAITAYLDNMLPYGKFPARALQPLSDRWNRLTNSCQLAEAAIKTSRTAWPGLPGHSGAGRNSAAAASATPSKDDCGPAAAIRTAAMFHMLMLASISTPWGVRMPDSPDDSEPGAAGQQRWSRLACWRCPGCRDTAVAAYRRRRLQAPFAWSEGAPLSMGDFPEQSQSCDCRSFVDKEGRECTSPTVHRDMHVIWI